MESEMFSEKIENLYTFLILTKSLFQAYLLREARLGEAGLRFVVH